MQEHHVDIKQMASSIRFVRGYRYLDRCGESVLRLQDTLDEGWIPGDLTLQSGNLVNHTLGMTLQFGADAVSLTQSEFIDFNYFSDQSCKAFDVLRRILDIPAINGPSLQVTFQKAYETVEAAEEYLYALKLVVPSQKLTQAVSGTQTAMSSVICTEMDEKVGDSIVVLRKRVETRSVRQERQPAFDERMMQRTRLLPKDQEKAMLALLKLRRQHRPLPAAAAQLTCEYAYETELKSEVFELREFYDRAWAWCDTAKRLFA